MDKRLVLGLASLAAASIVAYLASGERTPAASAPKRPDVGRVATDADLLEPPLAAPRSLARTKPAEAEAEPLQQNEASPPELTPDTPRPNAPIVVHLYRHATHDEHFPGERWTVGEGVTEAGVAFPDDDVSAIEVPSGVTVRLMDTLQIRHLADLGKELELGPGLHNLDPYGFNDRVDVVVVRRIESTDPERGRSYPLDVSLLEQRDGLTSRLGRIWTLKLPTSATTKLFTERSDYDGGELRGLWVPARFEVLLFSQPDGRGPAFGLGPGLYDLDHLGLRQRARSIRVLRTGE